jgi:hypothetical protein
MQNIIKIQNEKAAIKSLAIDAKIEVTANTLVEKHVLYTRNILTGKAGIIKLIETKDSAEDGVRNIDNAKLVGGESFVCTGIAISFAVGAAAITAADISKQVFSRGIQDVSKANQGFFNNELSLKIQNKQKLNIVLRHATPEMGLDEAVLNNYCEVTPFVINENQTILPELNCLSAFGTTDLPIVMELALIGYRLSSN